MLPKPDHNDLLRKAISIVETCESLAVPVVSVPVAGSSIDKRGSAPLASVQSSSLLS
jgi:hypothetical protein